MNKKQEVQDRIFESWNQADRNGIAIASVGIGKAKWIIDRCRELTKEFKRGTVMVLTNSTHLRDVGFLKELDKWWSREEFYQRCDIQCYQTAYKWTGQSFLAVFADEFDTSLSPEYSKFYWNNTWQLFMGLSGTMTEDQIEIAVRIAPLLFKYTVQKAQEDGVVNKVEIFVHNVPLSRINNYDTGKGFLTSEYKNIMYWNNSVAELEDEVNMQRQLIKDIQQNGMAQGLGIQDIPGLRRTLSGKTEYLKRKYIARSRQYYSLHSLVMYALELQEFILKKHPEGKILMFSKLTKIADKLGPAYHSKRKSIKTIDDFNSGKSRVLSVVGSVKRGVSFVDVTHSITHSMDSSKTNFTQREVGRMVRNNPDTVSKLHILNPVINDPEKGLIDLQPKKWIEKACAGFSTRVMNVPQWWDA